MIQLIANSIYIASIYIIIALGFVLIYQVAHFFHFAHGIIFTVGAYITFLFKVWLGFPLFLSIFISIGLTTILGCLIEICIYRPIRCQKASSFVFLLASLGIYIVLQNVISLIFGDDIKSIRIWETKEGVNIWGAKITPTQLSIIGISILLFSVCLWLVKYTKVGKAMRAVANDPELARVSGIKNDSIILVSFALGSALAGVAGILVAMDVDMTPTMGMNALMMGVVVMIIGGIGSIPGVALGALLLGLAQNVGAWEFGSHWQEAIAFIVLLFFLLFKPQGFFGRKVR